MKIKRLADGMISTAVADRYTDNDTKVGYFNLSHGTKGPNTWRWYAGLAERCFKSDEYSITLDDDNYNLLPIYTNGKLLRDRKGNICYNVIIDNDPSHRKDVLLLWSLPTRGYTGVTSLVTGGVDTIGIGKCGKSRGPTSITSEALVLEITGDCELTWIGHNTDGIEVKQVIKYTYTDSKWSVGGVVTTEVNDV